MANPVVTFEMENGDIIKAELYPEIAPNTVNNFISLVKKGFYDGLIFHRVIPGFMIQGGDPKGIGIGGPGYSIRADPSPLRPSVRTGAPPLARGGFARARQIRIVHRAYYITPHPAFQSKNALTSGFFLGNMETDKIKGGFSP